MVKVNRPRSNVVAHVKGWNDTHVLLDVYVGKRLVTENLSRPIERFMTTYGLSDV